jgi:hypothetical protein
MAEIVGITGLVTAIFDQILKLGERTDQLITDIRAFDEVAIYTFHTLKLVQLIEVTDC